MPLDPSRTQCAEASDILAVLLIPSLIVTGTIMINIYRPFIKNLRRRLGLSKYRVPQALWKVSFFLPCFLEVCANFMIAGLFKVWPGYKNTLTIGDMVTMGFIRPRMEWWILTHRFVSYAIVASIPQPVDARLSSELQPFFPRKEDIKGTGFPRGVLPLGGELHIQLWVLINMLCTWDGIAKQHALNPTLELPRNWPDMYYGARTFTILLCIAIPFQLLQVVAAVARWESNVNMEKAAERAMVDSGTQTLGEEAPTTATDVADEEDTSPDNTSKGLDSNVVPSSMELTAFLSDASYDDIPSSSQDDPQVADTPNHIPYSKKGKAWLLFHTLVSWMLPFATFIASMVFWSGAMYTGKGR